MWPITYETQFKRYINTLTSIIRTAKESYHKSKLKENVGNSKTTWEITNNIMEETTHRLPTSMTFPDKTLSTSKEISESLNNYLYNIASKLAHDSVSTSDSIRSPHHFHF